MSPPTTIWSGWSRYFSDAAIPKLPPPPLSAQTVLGHQPPEAAAEREPSDTRGGDRAARGREPVGGRLAVQLAPEHAALRSHDHRLWVDVDAPHGGQVDHQRVVDDRPPGDVVPAASHADVEPGRTGETDGVGDVRRAVTSCDQRRTPVDQPVVDPSGVLVALVIRPQQRPTETHPQPFELLLHDHDARRHVTSVFACPILDGGSRSSSFWANSRSSREWTRAGEPNQLGPDKPKPNVPKPPEPKSHSGNPDNAATSGTGRQGRASASRSVTTTHDQNERAAAPAAESLSRGSRFGATPALEDGESLTRRGKRLKTACCSCSICRNHDSSIWGGRL
jgi:hypothetical protein